MSLPIVLGARSVSSQQLPPPNPRHDDADDGAALEPVELFQTVAVCMCPKKEWSVRVTLSYYDLLRPDGRREITMVEARVQIAPACRPLCSSYRETVHHLKLPDGAQDEYPQADPCAVISPDRRNLACLLFHPHRQSSAIVIFQLRKPRTDNITNNLPLPSYVSESARKERIAPMLATNPRFVSAWGVTTICNIPNVSPPLLLCGCMDGHLIWIDYRSALSIATGDLGHGEAVRDLEVSATCLDRGTIVAIHPNGVATIASWKMEKSSQLTLLRHSSNPGTNIAQIPDSPSSHYSEVSPIPGGTKNNANTASDVAASLFHKLRFGPTTIKAPPLHAKRKVKSRESMDRFVLSRIRRKHGMTFRRVVSKRKLMRGFRRRSQGGNRDDTKRHMDISVIAEVEDVYAASILGSASSNLVAVLYRPGNVKTVRGNPCAVEVFGILSDHALKSVGQLELAPERVYELGLATTAPSWQEYDEGEGDGDEDTISELSVQTSQVLKSNKYGLMYDENSGCLAVSTMYYVSPHDFNMQSFACVWNWRINTIGHSMASSSDSLHSRLYFAHSELGPHLVHIEVNTGKQITLKKQIFKLGILSPPPSTEGSQITESCSVLLSGKSVSFPLCSQPTVTDSLDLEWKESAIPSNYTAAYGPPKIAAIGRQRASFLSIASSLGVCILDTDLQKWRLFGSETEERAFGVVAMTWWEGRRKTSGGDPPEHEAEDLLVAIIQANNGRQYLSCWSPNQLDLGHQLLEASNSQDEKGEIESWGIMLPKSFTATSLSLLEEPVASGRRRAIALVASPNSETSDIDHVLFQLQVVALEKKEPIESYVDKKPYLVKSNEVSCGTIRNGLSAEEPVSSVFLASGSFRFDLSHHSSDGDDEDTIAQKEYLATLGAIRTPGGLEAIGLFSRGAPLFSPVGESIEAAGYWLSDLICAKNTNAMEILPGVGMDVFVWAVQLVDGDILSWSVPYVCDYHSEDVSYQSSVVMTLEDSDEFENSSLSPPKQVCKSSLSKKQYSPMLGVCCEIGHASDWMYQSSSGIQSDLSMGQVPGSSFGCVLSAGQSSRKFRRAAPGGLDPSYFATDFLDYEVNCPSDFMMKPPSFVCSLYSLLLEVAYLRVNLDASALSSNMYHDKTSRLTFIENHMAYRLASSPNKDAVFMALRLLILRSVEMVAGCHKTLDKIESEESRSAVEIAKALYKEVVLTVDQCTTRLQFATIFLEVGRAVEPSVFEYLFPIPKPLQSNNSMHSTLNGTNGDDDNSKSNQVTSVADLVSLCLTEGSVATSASALPLLGTKGRSRKHCEKLLRHSLDAFCDNASSLGSARFDRTEEERSVVGDIFRFGIKLEDAAELEELNRTGHGSTVIDRTPPSPVRKNVRAISLGSGHMPTDEASMASSEYTERRSQLLCVGRRRSSTRQSSILGLLNSSFASLLSNEEDAISKAATSFIQEGFDRPPPATTFEPRPKSVKASIEPDIDPSELESVGGVVGQCVLDVLKASSTVTVPWKVMTSLSQILLQADVQLPRWENSFNVLSERVEIAGLESFIPDDYEGEDGVGRAASFLAAQISSCELEINNGDASLILDLVLFLLHRLQEFLPKEEEDVPTVCVGLMILSLIAGDVSGRVKELLDQLDDDCLLKECYLMASEELVSQ